MPIRTVAGATQPTAEDLARARTWASLPPEIQRNPVQRAKYIGLGEVVAAVAAPVARVLGIKHCAACDKRKKWLDAHAQFPRIFRRGTP